MAIPDDKMQLIGAAIISQAEKESKAIIERANHTRERELSEYEEQIIESMFDKVQQQTRAVRQKAIRDKAQAEAKAHRELLTRREEITLSVIADVTAKLHEYAMTEEYRVALLDSVKQLRDQYDHTTSTVYLRESDMALADKVTAALGGGEVAKDSLIKIGGFRLRNTAAGILVDETLDARLEDQKPWFLQHCGLKTI